MHRLFGGKAKPAPQQAPPPKPVAPKAAPKVDLEQTVAKMDAKSKALEDKINGLDKKIAVQFQKTKKSRGSSKRLNKQRLVKLMR